MGEVIDEKTGIKYWDEPSVASIWAIDYAPYYCNICGEFAGYRPRDAHFVGICSFKCAKRYLESLMQKQAKD